MRFCLSFVFLLLMTLCAAQGDHIVLVNSQPIDAQRYEGVKGSPYLFDDWIEAVVYNQKADEYKVLYVNLNGLENELEVTQDKKDYILADERNYPIVTVRDPAALRQLGITSLDEVKFVAKPRPHFYGNYYIELFNSKGYTLLYEFTASKNVTVERPPGKVIRTTRVKGRDKLILFTPDQEYTFKNNKKGVKKAFKEIGNFEKWAKQHKMKITSLDAMIGYLDFLSSK